MRLPLLALVLLLTLLAPIPAGSASGNATNFTVRDLSGKYLRLSDYNRQVVLISFWATWCKPCIFELRHLQGLYQKYKSRGLVVLAISMDGPESQANVKPMVQRYGFTFPVAIDRDTRVVKLYNPKHAAPFSVLVSRGRVVRYRESFQLSDLPAIEKDIQDQLR